MRFSLKSGKNELDEGGTKDLFVKFLLGQNVIISRASQYAIATNSKKEWDDMKRMAMLSILLVMVFLLSASLSAFALIFNHEQAGLMKEERVDAAIKSGFHSLKHKGEVTAKAYKKIHLGMTYKKVVMIAGSKGRLLKKIGNKDSESYTDMYVWNGEGRLGENVSMTFQEGKLINKSQFGLAKELSSNAAITLKAFNRIKKGMTYSKVQKIIGGQGALQGESGQSGSQFYTTIISYDGKKAGTHALFTFQGGKLQFKSQLGLK